MRQTVSPVYARGMEMFDPFAVLGLLRQYDVDAAAVQRAYLERSAQLHPDALGAGGGGVESDEASAALNRAKQNLDDPEQRAIALWRLLGGGGGGGEDKTLPPGFLMQMMEVREEVEAAARAGGEEARRKWESWAEDRRREYQGKVGALFARVESQAAADPSALKQIKAELNAWRYIERLIEQL